MPIAKRHDIYRALLETVKTISGVDDAFVHLAAQPLFSQESDVIVQIVPGGAEAQAERAGHGLVEEDFRVVTWKRLHADQARRDDIALSSASLGLMEIESRVMTALIQDLPDSETVVRATIYVRFIRGSSYSNSPDAPGWIFGELTFRVGYEINWPDPL